MLKTPAGRPRLMFVVTEDWYFVSHRLPLARAARDAGYEVLVATRLADKADTIRREGFAVIDLTKMRRTGRNPFSELSAITELVGIYRAHRPDIVHHIAMKPVLYGSIAARIAGVRSIVNNLAGLGFVFSSQSAKARVLRPAIRQLLALALNRPRTLTIVQNSDDARVMTDAIGVASAQLRLIKGSGVDPSLYPAQHQEEAPPLVVLASRMIRDKGIADFVAAATQLRRDGGAEARFVLLGSPDIGNPHAIPEAELQGYDRDGVVAWWGHRDDMPDILARSAIVCLPTTYGEGIPKILIEAAAAGCAIVAYDVAGCREIVAEGDNGLLVRPGDIAGLAAALGGLLADPARRAAMGQRGRARVEAEFAQERILAQTLATYAETVSR
ncbi:glycosyltransferase family 4 protein [Rubrivivax sp. JA1024]|nr:glycosyltransferase family 4 protein [Rubrivivax sp. JA1024]